MLAAILLVPVLHFLPDSLTAGIMEIRPVFWLEAIAVVAFECRTQPLGQIDVIGLVECGAVVADPQAGPAGGDQAGFFSQLPNSSVPRCLARVAGTRR